MGVRFSLLNDFPVRVPDTIRRFMAAEAAEFTIADAARSSVSR